MQVSIIAVHSSKNNNGLTSIWKLPSYEADIVKEISNRVNSKIGDGDSGYSSGTISSSVYDADFESLVIQDSVSDQEYIINNVLESGAQMLVIIDSCYSKKDYFKITANLGSVESKTLATSVENALKSSSFKSDGILSALLLGSRMYIPAVKINVGNANQSVSDNMSYEDFKNMALEAADFIADGILNYCKEADVTPEYTPGGVSDDASSKIAPDMTEATEYDMEIPARPSIQASIGAAAETVLANIHEKQMTITCDYLVYFDDVCMNDFVLSYSCALGVDMGIGRASVTLLYAPAFHQIKVNTSVADGIENGTQIRIFMRNVFDYTYNLCFEGIIKQRTIVRDAHGFTLSFSAVDYMYWMNKIIAPISIPLNEAISPGERLKWKAQSVDPETTANVEITQAGSLKGKTLQEYFDRLKTKSFENSKIYSEPNSVANWDDVVNRVEIMGDINEQLVHDEVIDFVVNSNAVFADTVYVSLSNTTQSLLMEMYQDRDGIVRIKPPFWNEPVLKNHIIDPMMILSAQESTDWNRYYTRIIVTGGVEEWMDSGTTAEKVDLLTPVGVYLGSLTDRNAAKWADYTTEGTLPSSYGSESVLGKSTLGDEVMIEAEKYLGVPYVYGGTTPDGFDCSGFVQYVYKQLGYTLSRVADDQMDDGIAVSYENLSPGDLVGFYSSPGGESVGHIGIYAGGGQMIHAPHTGDVVKYSSIETDYYTSRFAGGRRIIF